MGFELELMGCERVQRGKGLCIVPAGVRPRYPLSCLRGELAPWDMVSTNGPGSAGIYRVLLKNPGDSGFRMRTGNDPTNQKPPVFPLPPPHVPKDL